MKKIFLPILFSFFLVSAVFGQWTQKAADILPDNVNVFDVSVVSDQIIWAVCGDYNPNGPFPADVPTVILSTDGGETWAVKTVAGAKGRYSWDIHALDANTACITSQDLGTGPGRGIFRTTDGGQNWTETLHHVAGGYGYIFSTARKVFALMPKTLATPLTVAKTGQPAPSPVFNSTRATS